MFRVLQFYSVVLKQFWDGWSCPYPDEAETTMKCDKVYTGWFKEMLTDDTVFKTYCSFMPIVTNGDKILCTKVAT